MTPAQPRHPLALLADWIEAELAWIAAPMGSVAECNARDAVEPLHTSLLSLDPAALRAQAGAEVVEPWRTIPLDIAQMVVATGRAQWADTEVQDAQGHGAAMTNSVQLTAETFGQTEPQPMQLLVIEGTDTVLGYMGTSPNSPVIARAMTGAWNWLHEQSAHALAQAGGES